MSITVKHISKAYKNNIQALKNISFQVEKGEIFGLIGPDGAGKTTLFRILTTLLLPCAGTAQVAGYDIVKDYLKIRKSVGYMPGKFSLYQDLSVEENLEFFASVFGTSVKENYDLIKDIYRQLEPFKKRRAKDLSGGMKQKLALSCALIHKPEVLFLDEPTTGVDPVSRKEFWEMLKKLHQKGMTILVSTPYMDEAALCHRIALIENGKILQIDTPENIAKNFPKTIYNIKANNTYLLIETLKKYPFTYSVYPFGEYIHYTDKREKFNTKELYQYLFENQLSDIEIHQTQPTIEDTFMELAK